MIKSIFICHFRWAAIACRSFKPFGIRFSASISIQSSRPLFIFGVGMKVNYAVKLIRLFYDCLPAHCAPFHSLFCFSFQDIDAWFPRSPCVCNIFKVHQRANTCSVLCVQCCCAFVRIARIICYFSYQWCKPMAWQAMWFIILLPIWVKVVRLIFLYTFRCLLHGTVLGRSVFLRHDNTELILSIISFSVFVIHLCSTNLSNGF